MTQIYHHDEHFEPQKKPPHFDEFDQVLEISHVQAIFQDYRPDLHQEVVDIFAKTQKDAWNKLNKYDAPAGSYAHYDFWEDTEGLLSHHRPVRPKLQEAGCRRQGRRHRLFGGDGGHGGERECGRQGSHAAAADLQ